MNNKAKLITIEGCEGSGKSTQLELIKKHLARKGIDAVMTREPGGVPLAESIRPIILGKNNIAVSGLAELMLFGAARAQHVSELIKPALKEGRTVVCDRFVDSTLAYQGYARGICKRKIRSLNRIALDGLKVDLTIFLDIAPALAFERKKGFDTEDRMESETLEFHTNVYNGYKAIAKADPNRVKVVDASLDIDNTFRQIAQILETYGI